MHSNVILRFMVQAFQDPPLCSSILFNLQFLQHCFICHPPPRVCVPENAGFEPRNVPKFYVRHIYNKSALFVLLILKKRLHIVQSRWHLIHGIRLRVPTSHPCYRYLITLGCLFLIQARYLITLGCLFLIQAIGTS